MKCRLQSLLAGKVVLGDQSLVGARLVGGYWIWPLDSDTGSAV